MEVGLPSVAVMNGVRSLGNAVMISGLLVHTWLVLVKLKYLQTAKY